MDLPLGSLGQPDVLPVELVMDTEVAPMPNLPQKVPKGGEQQIPAGGSKKQHFLWHRWSRSWQHQAWELHQGQM